MTPVIPNMPPKTTSSHVQSVKLAKVRWMKLHECEIELRKHHQTSDIRHDFIAHLLPYTAN